MDRIVTTLLDVLGLLLVAAGAYFLAEPHMGRAGLMVAGVVVLAGSAFASREPSAQPVGPRVRGWLRSVADRVKGAVT